LAVGVAYQSGYFMKGKKRQIQAVIERFYLGRHRLVCLIEVFWLVGQATNNYMGKCK
jgi:hypothetical protein